MFHSRRLQNKLSNSYHNTDSKLASKGQRRSRLLGFLKRIEQGDDDSAEDTAQDLGDLSRHSSVSYLNASPDWSRHSAISVPASFRPETPALGPDASKNQHSTKSPDKEEPSPPERERVRIDHHWESRRRHRVYL
jgi:hypothetical protein